MTGRRMGLLAAGVALVVYLPSVGGGFLYDDVSVVVENRAIRDLRLIGTVLRAEPARPLLGLTWALNYAVAGLEPWPYHLVNVLVHAGNAALLASLFAWMAARSRRPDPQASALLGACLFAASPMAAETVAYVSSRSTALATLFGLGSLRLAVGVLEWSSIPRSAAAMALFVIALATKEEAAAIPILLLLLDFFFVAEQKLPDLQRRWRTHLPFLALPVAGLAARAAVTGAWLPPAAMGHGRYLATQLAVFPLYLLRALVPFDPAFYRGQPAASWPPEAWALIGWLGTGVIVWAAVSRRRRWPEWSLAVAWLAAGLMPSSSLVPLKEMAVDHRAYLGSAGIAFALGGALWRAGRLPAAIVLALWAGVAFRYEWILADPARAWQDAVRRVPFSAEAHLALGEAYAARGDRRAEWAFERALALDSRGARGWTNLGAYYAQTGRIGDAERALRAASQAAPGDARIHDNLGMILRALGREDEAAAEFEAAVAAGPGLAQPRINLAALLIRRGDRARARALLDEASRLPIDPQDAEALVALQRLLGPP